MIILEKGTPPPPMPRKGYKVTCYACKSVLVVEPIELTGESSYKGSTDRYYICPVCNSQNPIATYRNGKSIEPETLIEL